MAEIGSTVLTGNVVPNYTEAGNPATPTTTAKSSSLASESMKDHDNSYGATILAGEAPLSSAYIPSFYFKMRALASPGPGFVVWVRTNFPDFAGTYAPAAIQPGTTVITDSWSA